MKNFRINIRRPQTLKGWLMLAGGIVFAAMFIALAWTLGLVALLVSFTIVIIQAVWAFLLYLAAQLGVLSIIAWVSAQLAALLAWFATTWLGTLIMPIINWLLPIASKFGPWVTLGKWGRGIVGWIKSMKNKSESTAEQLIDVEPESVKRQKDPQK